MEEKRLKFKKIILLTVIFITFLSVSVVSANENITDDISTENIVGEELEISDSNEIEEISTSEISEVKTSENNLLKITDDETFATSDDNSEILTSNDNPMKITLKPLKVYSNKKFTYTAKLTNNGKPVSGVWLDLSIHDASNGVTSTGARTNSNGIATFKMDSERVGKYDVTVEMEEDEDFDGYAYAKSYINVVKNPKSKTTVKAPKITAKYKQSKYFKITVKDYKGKPVKKLKLTLDIKTGTKWKIYHVKTNNNGVAKFNVKKLKSGTHDVLIYIDDAHTKYDLEKESKIIITKTVKKTTTKKTTTKKKTSYKTFKSPSGYKWKIKTSTWNKMKKQAKSNYAFSKSVGSGRPGYSDSVTVKLTKNGHTYTGTALAIRNSNYMRCEVRGAVNGVYISDKGDQIV